MNNPPTIVLVMNSRAYFICRAFLAPLHEHVSEAGLSSGQEDAPHLGFTARATPHPGASAARRRQTNPPSASSDDA